MSRFGLDLYGLVKGPVISSLVSDISKVFNPIGILGNIVGSVTGRNAIAASATDTSNYGVVQWGWTTQETNLMENTASYQPAENELILDNPANATNLTNIENTFGQCYTKSMGELLSGSNILIDRDANGNVIGGLCTEAYLGPDDSTYGYDAFENNNDLVFRWRLEKTYSNGADLLNGIANPSGQSTLVPATWIAYLTNC